MAQLPKLAILGRPNVGKSALFNCICKKRVAIVDEAEGITRDRLYAKAELFGKPFEVIDTGGIDSNSKLPFQEQITRQAEIAIEEADALVLVVDAQVGVTELDRQVAKLLKRVSKPLCLAINKVDHPDQQQVMHDFHSLGISKMVPVSATQRWQIADLLETALEETPFPEEEEDKDESIRVAIIGRPNVGKSSLLNALLNEERSIVSEIPGTTRDSIDTKLEHNGTLFTFIDTAGIRRKHAEHEVVDKFASLRTERAIERADLCLLMLDAEQGLTTQEKRIASLIEEAGKGCVLIFNKWDLVKGVRMEHYLKAIEEEAPFLHHCPKLFISAKTGRNLDKIFDHILSVYHFSRQRIGTGRLNKFVSNCLQKNHPPAIHGKRLRIYYLAQVAIEPPFFVLFVNSPSLMSDSYKKYLINQLRDTFSYSGVPLKLQLRGKTGTRKRKGPPLKEITGYHVPSEEEGELTEDLTDGEETAEGKEFVDDFFEFEED